MKINLEFIKRIFNLEIKLKNKEDKIKLSKYEDLIPMYDIYSQKIYPINKQNVHYRLIESHYRFINDEIYQWIQNLYEKYSIDPTLGPKFKYSIDLMNNYDIPTLIETSYKTLYKYSPMLGLLVSICKRNSFHPYIYHLKPYYTKLELIKLGQNMNVIETKIDPEYLIDQSTHYKICKMVSNNDVSFDEIKRHHQYILDSNLISWVCFYSFTGSFIFNKFLRNLNVSAIRGTNNREPRTSLQKFNPIFYQGLQKIVSSMENSPPLDNDYDIYRFIWDDSFIMGLKERDVFIDKGFVSTTRDPFYSPGLNGNFGLILLKIKIPKNKKGMGLFIENFSLFPREEEFLLAPYSKLKLISKNDNFKYFHTNPEFEKIINRKYEFELVGIDYSNFHLENPSKLVYESNNNYYQIESIVLNGIDRVELIRKFIIAYSDNNQLNIKVGSDKYSFTYQWFDSTNSSSYDKFYYNKIKDGILFSLFDSNGYPYLNIELGQDFVINWLNKLYFRNNNIEYTLLDDKLMNIIYQFGRIFNYKSAMIFHNYNSFDKFKDSYDDSLQIFLNMNLFNDTIYSYLTTGTKYLNNLINFNPFINYNLGYWYLDEYFNKPIDKNIEMKLPDKLKEIKTIKELYIKTNENTFYFYPKLVELIDKNIIKNDYVTFNIYDKLVAEGLADNFKPNIEYTNEDIIDSDFKLIFRQPIRRL
jgi:hypothetical protein